MTPTEYFQSALLCPLTQPPLKLRTSEILLRLLGKALANTLSSIQDCGPKCNLLLYLRSLRKRDQPQTQPPQPTQRVTRPTPPTKRPTSPLTRWHPKWYNIPKHTHNLRQTMTRNQQQAPLPMRLFNGIIQTTLTRT